MSVLVCGNGNIKSCSRGNPVGDKGTILALLMEGGVFGGILSLENERMKIYQIYNNILLLYLLVDMRLEV